MSIVNYFIENGWEQSCTETENGCVFEKKDDTDLEIISVNKNGLRVASARFNSAAVRSGAAAATVRAFSESLNGGGE